MTKRADYATSLDVLLAGSPQPDSLERFLAGQSGLPGPRGNLELADTFADVVARGAALGDTAAVAAARAAVR